MSKAQTDGATIPEWDVADRMRKALRSADLPVQEIADYLGVSRNTVSTWINGRINPSTQTLRLWSLRCGVPFEWLTTGKISGVEPAPDGGSGVVSVTQRFTTPPVSTAEILSLRKHIGYPGGTRPDRRTPRTARHLLEQVSA